MSAGLRRLARTWALSLATWLLLAVSEQVDNALTRVWLDGEQ